MESSNTMPPTWIGRLFDEIPDDQGWLEPGALARALLPICIELRARSGVGGAERTPLPSELWERLLKVASGPTTLDLPTSRTRALDLALGTDQDSFLRVELRYLAQHGLGQRTDAQLIRKLAQWCDLGSLRARGFDGAPAWLLDHVQNVVLWATSVRALADLASHEQVVGASFWTAYASAGHQRANLIDAREAAGKALVLIERDLPRSDLSARERREHLERRSRLRRISGEWRSAGDDLKQALQLALGLREQAERGRAALPDQRFLQRRVIELAHDTLELEVFIRSTGVQRIDAKRKVSAGLPTSAIKTVELLEQSALYQEHDRERTAALVTALQAPSDGLTVTRRLRGDLERSVGSLGEAAIAVLDGDSVIALLLATLSGAHGSSDPALARSRFRIALDRVPRRLRDDRGWVASLHDQVGEYSQGLGDNSERRATADLAELLEDAWLTAWLAEAPDEKAFADRWIATRVNWDFPSHTRLDRWLARARELGSNDRGDNRWRACVGEAIATTSRKSIERLLKPLVATGAIIPSLAAQCLYVAPDLPEAHVHALRCALHAVWHLDASADTRSAFDAAPFRGINGSRFREALDAERASSWQFAWSGVLRALLHRQVAGRTEHGVDKTRAFAFGDAWGIPLRDVWDEAWAWIGVLEHSQKYHESRPDHSFASYRRRVLGALAWSRSRDERTWAFRKVADEVASLLPQGAVTIDVRGVGRGQCDDLRWPAPEAVQLVIENAVLNSVRAGATHIAIDALAGQGRLDIVMEDDGCGFDISAVRAARQCGWTVDPPKAWRTTQVRIPQVELPMSSGQGMNAIARIVAFASGVPRLGRTDGQGAASVVASAAGPERPGTLIVASFRRAGGQ